MDRKSLIYWDTATRKSSVTDTKKLLSKYTKTEVDLVQVESFGMSFIANEPAERRREAGEAAAL